MTTIKMVIPREVNSWRAAGILYGDLGTSKAYVLGLAFALAGHSSFWFILAVSILTLMVGINYILICKFYPYGGGVYSSARNRSRLLSIIGAFFLISDYLVTAALSSLSAFHYLGVPNPTIWAMVAILAVGLFNNLGPKQTGNFSIVLAIPTILCVILLALVLIPFVPTAIQNLEPISYDLAKDWNVFVGIIVALSGIESIANTTRSMQLDPGSTEKAASVIKTSTPAILAVIFEVGFFTALFGLAMNALPHLQIANGTVNAPDFPNVRDAMLRYMGQTFAGDLFGPAIGYVFGLVVSVVITLLLFSAVNTSMIALSSLLFVMSRDRELPHFFQSLNRFGVPIYSLMVSFLFPIGILLIVNDIPGLANLYAIGFVGAIAVNLGATSTNPKLDMSNNERFFMFATFLIMVFIEITLFIDKPEARGFVITIMALGLLMRALVAEQKREVKKIPKVAHESLLPKMPAIAKRSWLLAVTGFNPSLDYALQECSKHNIALNILFIREQKVITDEDAQKTWQEDFDACLVHDYILATKPKNPTDFLYAVTSHTAYTIAQVAQEKTVDHVIVGQARRYSAILHVLRGTTVHDVARYVPKNIGIIVIY